MYVSVPAMSGACMGRSENKLQGLVLEFYLQGPEDQTQVVRFSSKYRYLLSHLTGPQNINLLDVILDQDSQKTSSLKIYLLGCALPLSASHVLGLKVCATTSQLLDVLTFKLKH